MGGKRSEMDDNEGKPKLCDSREVFVWMTRYQRTTKTNPKLI